MSAYETSRKRTWRIGVDLDRRALTPPMTAGLRPQEPLVRLAATDAASMMVMVRGTHASPSCPATVTRSASQSGESPVAGTTKGVDRFPGLLVWRTDHVRLGDVGMRRQHPLDRPGVMEGSR